MQSEMKRRSTSDIAYLELRRRIVEWELLPFEQLVEETLSTDLQYSRTPLRKALYRLELEGLIVRLPNGRMHVADITVQEVEEIFKTREVLEGLLARDACNKLTDNQMILLSDALSLMKIAAEQDRKMDTVKYGSDFHKIIQEASVNNTAIRFINQINHRIDRYRRIGGKNDPDYDPIRPVIEHTSIYNAFLKRDAELAERLMREHIQSSFIKAKATLENYFNQS